VFSTLYKSDQNNNDINHFHPWLFPKANGLTLLIELEKKYSKTAPNPYQLGDKLSHGFREVMGLDR
jgi:hypothetical protein